MSSPNNYQNLGSLNADVIVGAKRAVVLSLTCHNAGAAARFLLLLDQTTTPINGQIPTESFVVGVGEQIIIGTDYFTPGGVEFSSGLAWAWSSTRHQVTLGTAADQNTRIKWSL